MTLEELGRFILRRIYHLRIIPRMIFPRKNYFPRTVSTENIIYLNAPTLQNMQNIHVPIYVEL